MDEMPDEEFDAELDRIAAEDRSEAMTRAEYEAWFAATKAKVAASVDDPRPPVPIKEAFERVRRELRLSKGADEAA